MFLVILKATYWGIVFKYFCYFVSLSWSSQFNALIKPFSLVYLGLNNKEVSYLNKNLFGDKRYEYGVEWGLAHPQYVKNAQKDIGLWKLAKDAQARIVLKCTIISGRKILTRSDLMDFNSNLNQLNQTVSVIISYHRPTTLTLLSCFSAPSSSPSS